MKKILLLGATGSIGQSTFEIVRKNPDKFQIVGASAHARFTKLEHIAQKLRIPNLLNTSADDKYDEFIQKCQPDIVLNAIVGFAGLKFTIETLKHGIPLALANKESLVAGGDLVMQLAKEKNVPILPVDSEHSAIFQCLNPITPPSSPLPAGRSLNEGWTRGDTFEPNGQRGLGELKGDFEYKYQASQFQPFKKSSSPALVDPSTA